MTTLAVLLMATGYGAVLGLAFDLLLAAVGEAPALGPLPIPIGATVTLFVAYRTTFAVAWNRRAARIRAAENQIPIVSK